jgi:hypothetical protein
MERYDMEIGLVNGRTPFIPNLTIDQVNSIKKCIFQSKQLNVKLDDTSMIIRNKYIVFVCVTKKPQVSPQSTLKDDIQNLEELSLESEFM